MERYGPMLYFIDMLDGWLQVYKVINKSHQCPFDIYNYCSILYVSPTS
jgi:hypothetical protein